MDKRQFDISTIIKSVKKAYCEDMKEFYTSYKLISNNSDPGLRWDFINTNINDKLSNDIYKTILVKRGPWKQIIVYNTEDKRLYFVMREYRYKNVKEDKKRKNLHLIQILGSVNEANENEASIAFKKKLPEYISKAKEYILLTYEYNENVNEFDFICRKITSKFKCNYKEQYNSNSISEIAN